VPPLRVRQDRPEQGVAGLSRLQPNPIPSTSPGAGSGSDSGPVDPLESGDTPFSEPPATSVKIGKKSLAEIARGAVLTASLYVHQALARTEPEQAEDVWVARDQDQAQIGDPLASIATRRGANVLNPDVASLIEAGIGLVAYAIYHGTKAWQIRRGLRKLAALSPEATNHATGEPA
jgi:hypothetical protein